MMEGVLPEAWDLILFKTMVLYIYKVAYNIKNRETAFCLYGGFNHVNLFCYRGWLSFCFLRILYITEAFYEISKLE